jgi:pimeloyl-ACP methyl ester carboxylesterase
MRTAVRLVLLCSLLAACSSDPAPSARPSPALEAPVEPAVVVEETPPEPRVVRFTTSDGVTIVGDLAPATRPDAGAVILLHQLGSDRSEWAPLLTRLHASPSITTLSIDMRGHGESTVSTAGEIEFHAFDNDAWARTQEDVLAAVAFLGSDESGVRPARISAVGSSIGSTAVVAAAAREPRIASFAVISPGRAYHGFDALTPMLELGSRGFFAIVSRDETEGVETAEAMARVTHTDAMVVDGTIHGVAVFAAEPSTLDRLEEFLRGDLGASAP